MTNCKYEKFKKLFILTFLSIIIIQDTQGLSFEEIIFWIVSEFQDNVRSTSVLVRLGTGLTKNGSTLSFCTLKLYYFKAYRTKF